LFAPPPRSFFADAVVVGGAGMAPFGNAIRTASAHFLLGGRVRGGLYGLPPALDRLDGNGNPPFAVDFRDLYATVLGRWWGLDATVALNGRFSPLDVLKT
jgi:uncharacterized protein (DUF1501 family)